MLFLQFFGSVGLGKFMGNNSRQIFLGQLAYLKAHSMGNLFWEGLKVPIMLEYVFVKVCILACVRMVIISIINLQILLLTINSPGYTIGSFYEKKLHLIMIMIIAAVLFMGSFKL